MRKRGDLDSGRPDIDAVNGCAIDLCWRIQPLGRCADEPEFLRLLQRKFLRDGHASGIRRKLAVSHALSCGGVKHLPPFGAARRRIDVPPLCRGRNQHRSRGCTGFAQRLPRASNGIRIARCLHAQKRIGIELLIRRRVLEPHLLKLDFQLFGDQHRDGRIGPLAHFHISHGQDDLPVGADADERVRSECNGIRRFGLAICQWQSQAKQ